MKKSLMLLIVAATLVGCGAKEKAAIKADDKPVDVKVAVAYTGDVDVTEVYTAELKAFKENNITPAAAGLHIDEIRVDVGDKVKEGDVIVTLDKTTLIQQELNLAITQDSYDRMKPVHAAGGVSDQQMTQLENTLNLQKEAVAQLRKNSVIKSPITGVVTARNFEPGDLYASMPILHIMQIDKLKVKAYVSEKYFANVKVGNKIDIEVDVYPGEVFEGSVSRIDPAIDAATRTFGVEVVVPNKDERLRPGMSARAVFNMGQRESVMIPATAVQKQAGSSERYVFVIEEGVADYRFVNDGRRVGEFVEIFDGVKAGDKVAITGFGRLLDQKQVNIVE